MKNILLTIMCLSMLFSDSTEQLDTSENNRSVYMYQSQPTFSKTDSMYTMEINEHGAVLKNNNTSKIIYLGKDCDTYSRIYGKGKWRFHDKSVGFWIAFESGIEFSTNRYGYGIADNKWDLKMPDKATKCRITWDKPIIATTECSSDPKLTTEMDFEKMTKQLNDHGWKLEPIDPNECAGSGLGYCNTVATDCNDRVLFITTVGGESPSGISWWGLSD